MTSAQPVRILFVDDELGIRETISAILQQHGFDVDTAATVPEALAKIMAGRFDVLLADLNIGSPGDGFTVVSAMRRTQKDCVTLILTGYPAFDTALQAIRGQVDDYLIKPAHPRALVEAIETKLRDRKPQAKLASLRIHEVLMQNADRIAKRTLEKMKADPESAALAVSDEQRIGHLPDAIRFMSELIAMQVDHLPPFAVERLLKIGELRRAQGYPLHLMIRNVGFVQSSIFEIVHENLLSVNLSVMMPDLKRIGIGLSELTEHTVTAYLRAEERAA